MLEDLVGALEVSALVFEGGKASHELVICLLCILQLAPDDGLTLAQANDLRRLFGPFCETCYLLP